MSYNTECVVMADIVFVLDSSGSITETDQTNWDKMLKFIKDVVTIFSSTGGDMRFALVSFSDNATVEFYLDTRRENILTEINNIKYLKGRTNIADGLQTVRQEIFKSQRGDRINAPNIIILITDGIPNERIDDTTPQAVLLKKTGAYLLIVGVTDAVDDNRLKDLATQPSYYIKITTYAALDSTTIVNNLVSTACQSVIPGMFKY